MNCVICEKPTNRKVKDLLVCPECTKMCQETRDHLNFTRTNPSNKYNILGEPPVTLREVVIRAVLKLAEKEKDSETNT